ncbi:unnamed protein product [Didymodactylos carnosus]|uniref:CCHC-type domain-containing protein n=1 Tax=Didymodactylos carnosus TaxID=1234261 RepID=A0A815IHM3_9BILA|nr:unnamed protein product [Didymodactylos carnosus]CAF4247479.1 unnamed protein product [Didymodactylos carnosus]
MTTAQKDRLCEGIETQQKLQEFYARENGRNATLKRHNTNHSHLNLDMDEDLNDYDNDEVNNDFQQVNYGRPRKKFVNRNEIDERIIVRTITNSNMNMNSNNNRSQQQNLHRQQQKSNNNNNANNNNNNQTITISSQALKYAAENHLQPIKIECNPKLTDQKQAAKLMDAWWIDKDGNLNGVTKQIDLYVYLCDLKRYPNEVDKIKLTPHPPRHLPLQRSTLLKWVKNSVSLNEVKEELENKFKSIYSVEDIIGTKNNRNRHIRIDFSDEREYIDVLNSGKISLFGQLYDIDEYLPAPKLLFCSKCNKPGHIKKVCVNSPFEICRRCGGDRNDEKDHKTCDVKCHHCDGNHTSTDYSCPIIQEYRRQLVFELRKRPDLLPPEAQLFIPSECRENGENTKVLENKSAKFQQQLKKQRQHLQRNFNYNDLNAWPSISPSLTNTTTTMQINTNINGTIKTLSDELQKLKWDYVDEQRKIEEKYKNHLNLLNQSWLIMQQQVQAQTQMVTTMNGVINTTLFSTCSIAMETLRTVLDKIKTETNKNECDAFINQIQLQILLLNEQKSAYFSHQTKLEQLLTKQKEALDVALNTIIHQPNV